MKIINKYPILLTLVLISFATSTLAQIRAFPGAEGYGAFASGGRGGQVIHVTNLNNSGPGSLQEAVSTPGPRIVVFDVGGVIWGDITITEPDLTIAGETAPAPGITIAGRLWTAYNYSMVNYIIRFIRIRPTALSGRQGDAIQFSRASNLIFDHVNVSWGSDETVDLYEAQDVTFQYCFIEESATYAHPEGNFHNYGMINGPDGRYISLHHNLFAHHNHRTPAIANGPADIVNNVIYNTTTGFVHHNPANNDCFMFLGNYMKTGPDRLDINPFWFDDEDGTFNASYYLNDNWVDDDPDYQGNMNDPKNSSYSGVDWYDPAINITTTACKAVDVTVHPVAEAYDLVLDTAGSFPRDVVATRTVNEVNNRSGSWGCSVPADLLEGLPTESAPADTDQDGMPDYWETARGLNPNVADDNGDDDSDGYTNIEEYLHDRVNTLLNIDPTPVVTTIVVSPDPVTVDVNTTQQFSVQAYDQDGDPISATFTWSSTGVGSINSSGLYSAGSTAGTAVVTASADGVDGMADVTVTESSQSVTLQAEDATVGGGAFIQSDHFGYNGTGFINFPSSGGYVSYSNVDGGNGGATTMTIRWALGSSSRTGELIVNGVSQSLTMEGTGSWDSWNTKDVSITLNAGTSNTIRFESTGQDFGNLDEITVAIGGGAPVVTTVVVSPDPVTMNVNTTQQFSAQAYDQDGDPISATFTWSSTGVGSINSSGLYSAGSTARTAVVTATAVGTSVSGDADVTVQDTSSSDIAVIFDDAPAGFVFSGGYATRHSAAVVSGEGLGDSDAIKYYNIVTNNWTRLHALNFSSNPLDISALQSSGYLEISIDIGSVGSPLSGIRVYFNGFSWEGAPYVDLPQVDNSSGYEIFQVAVSSIYNQLGTQLTQLHIYHGNWPVSTVWVDNIKLISN